MSSTFNKKYKIIKKIGEGSFSDVLKCQDRVTGLFYAAKRLKKSFHDISEIYENPEIMAMRKISRHPNILYMIESHYEPLAGKVTLIFDLMDMNLYDLIKRRKNRMMSEQKVKAYLYQLLKGLEHLHKHGMFHRDIKPENILLKRDLVKLADFGSVRVINSRRPYTEYISTRWYRSPECLLTDGYYGPKMDIWAIGCVFYELLTLKPLFPGSNEVDQITKIHTILGSPHDRVVAKFRRHNSRNCDYCFSIKQGIGFTNLLPYITESGKELLKMMLVYDPESRSDVTMLLEHRYFDHLKQSYISRQIISSVTLPSISSSGSCHYNYWNARPSLINSRFSSKEINHGYKDINETRRRIKPSPLISLPKIIPPINAIQNNTNPQIFNHNKPSLIKLHKNDPNDDKNSSKNEDGTKIYLLRDVTSRISSKSWKPLPNKYSLDLKNYNNNNKSSKSTTNFSVKLPSINSTAVKKYSIPKLDFQSTSNYSSEYKLRRHFYSKFNESAHDEVKEENKINECAHKIDCKKSLYFPQIDKKIEYHPLPVIMDTITLLKNYDISNVEEKRKSKLNIVGETRYILPQTRSSTIRSPVKKMAKHETTSKSLGKILPVKRNLPRRLRGRDRL